MLALCVLPVLVLVFAGLMRRFQIARTQHALERMGFIGSAPSPRQTRPLWVVLGPGVIGVVALLVATVVLPGPPAGRVLASTDGSSILGAPTHAPVVPSATNPGSEHSTSEAPAPTQGSENPPASPPGSVSPAANAGSDAGAPSTVTARSTSATAIHLQWAPVSGAAAYHVERSTDTVTWGVVGKTIGERQTRFTDAALSSGTTYYYRVAAVDGEAVSRSDVVSATTTVDTPAAPVLMSATGSATSVDLAWSDVPGEAGFSIERSPDGTTTTGWAEIGTTGQGVTSFTDTGLAPTTTYFYRVVAVTSDGGSSLPSGVLPATTGPGGSSGGPSTSGANADPSLAPTGP